MRSRALASAAALLLASCGSSPAAPRPCAGPTDCLAGSFCRGGRCAESTPPVAVISLPSGPLLSHTHLLLDGSGSRDADVADGDQVTAWRWAARAVAAPCEPAHPVGSAPAYDLVAGCAGTFEVLLTVADTTGRASEPARALLALDLSPTPPSAAISGPASLAHRCQGLPLLCTTAGPSGETSFSLRASAEHPVTGPFTYAWSAVPPPGLTGPAPRIAFEPPDSASPEVRIETDGTAISGEYELKVVATDAEGLAAVAVHRLTVENQPPVVLGGGELVVGHGFDAAGSRFVSSGAVQASASDPDGDPITSAGFLTVHEGAGGGTFELAAAGSAADFTISVPYRVPEDALFLVGGAGLRRAIVFGVADVNGGAGQTVWEVRVANRPPRLVAAVDASAADHSFDTPSLSYRASAALSAYADDDGDPIVQRGPTGDADCAAIDPVVGSGSPLLRCRRVYAGVPEAHLFAVTRAVSVVLGDPFEAVAARPFSLSIGNRPPRITESVPIATTCAPSSPPLCCRRGPPPDRLCLEEAFDAGAGSIVIPPPVVDDDGDPVSIAFASGAGASAQPAAMTCTPATCPNVALSVEAVTAACVGPAVSATVSDGSPPVQGQVALGACF